jgi:hypothetical protein
VSDRGSSPELLFEDQGVLVDLRDQTDTLMGVKPRFSFHQIEIARDDSSSFLTSMLQRMQSVVSHDCGIRMIENSENTAMAAGFSFEKVLFSHCSKVRKNTGLNKDGEH